LPLQSALFVELPVDNKTKIDYKFCFVDGTRGIWKKFLAFMQVLVYKSPPVLA
jgi:hypothetical protein